MSKYEVLKVTVETHDMGKTYKYVMRVGAELNAEVLKDSSKKDDLLEKMKFQMKKIVRNATLVFETSEPEATEL